MTTPALIAIGTLLFATGFGLGIFGCLVWVKQWGLADDTLRLDRIELMGWHIGHMHDRWAVLKEIDGRPTMLSQSNETLRGAIDGVPHG